jgi:hypothetical protein
MAEPEKKDEFDGRPRFSSRSNVTLIMLFGGLNVTFESRLAKIYAP